MGRTRTILLPEGTCSECSSEADQMEKTLSSDGRDSITNIASNVDIESFTASQTELERTLKVLHIPAAYTERWLSRRLEFLGTVKNIGSKLETIYQYTAVIVFNDIESIKRVTDYIEEIRLIDGDISECFGKVAGVFATWEKKAEPHPMSLAYRTVCIDNIDSKMTEANLLDMCLDVGPVESTTIPYNYVAKEQRPYGFVVFKFAFSVAEALKSLEGKEVHGKKIHVIPHRTSCWHPISEAPKKEGAGPQEFWPASLQ